mgnify:CR=1 FL=1
MIVGFEMNFFQSENEDEATVFNPYVLAGKNGSGKSSFLNVITEKEIVSTPQSKSDLQLLDSLFNKKLR